MYARFFTDRMESILRKDKGDNLYFGRESGAALVRLDGTSRLRVGQIRSICVWRTLEGCMQCSHH